MANPKPVVPLTPEQRQMVEDNIGLVYDFAGKFRGFTDIEYDEIISICMLALVVGVQKYDPSRGFTFSTYLYRAMLNNIRTEYRNNKSVRDLLYLEEVGQIPGTDESDWEQMLDSGIDIEAEALCKIAIEQTAESLPPRQRQILELHAIHPGINQREVAAMTGVTFQRVEQIYKIIRPKLRQALAV